MTQRLLLCCLACLLSLSLFHSDIEAADQKYDLFFKRWGEYYAPWEDWRWYRSQGMAESGLNQAEVSYVGAIGLMQLMPLTAKDLGVNPYDPELNVKGGIKYDTWLWGKWRVIADIDSRRNLMFASYNAGLGWIIKARKIAGSDDWELVAAALPLVTGKNAKETQGYVKRINRIYWTGVK